MFFHKNGNDGDLRLDRTKTVSPPVSPDHSTLDCTADGEGVTATQSAPDGHGEWSTVARHRKTTTGMQQKQQQQRKIVGTHNEADTAVKSGVKIIKKADCTPALLTDYLLAVDVEVLSCYAAKL